jgi:tryptophan-rich sensory protein
MNVSDADPVLIVAPMMLSWITTFFTGKIEERHEYIRAWFQPPGWVFFVVWTALYIMFGFLLYQSKREEDYTTMGLVIGVLFLTYLWQYLFSYLKNYKLALYDLLALLIIGWILYVRLNYSPVVDNTTFGEGYIMIYVPFLAWIIFALLLSINTKYYKSPEKKRKMKS